MLDSYPLELFIKTDPYGDEGKRLKKDFLAAIIKRLEGSKDYTIDIEDVIRELNTKGHKFQPNTGKHGFSYSEYIADKWVCIGGLEDWVNVAFQVLDENVLSKFLEKYSGESVGELIKLASTYRVDSIVLAFESALLNKKAPNEEELTILAVEALEREVNNGGYDQFFVNSSNMFVSVIVVALRRIGCSKTARITQKAVDALGISGDLTVKSIETVMKVEDEKRAERLSECDDLYFEASEPIAERLFKFIKKNRKSIQFHD